MTYATTYNENGMWEARQSNVCQEVLTYIQLKAQCGAAEEAGAIVHGGGHLWLTVDTYVELR